MTSLAVRTAVFLIYLAGVAWITLRTPELRDALGTSGYLATLLFYLLGVSRTATVFGEWCLRRLRRESRDDAQR